MLRPPSWHTVRAILIAAVIVIQFAFGCVPPSAKFIQREAGPHGGITWFARQFGMETDMLRDDLLKAVSIVRKTRQHIFGPTRWWFIITRTTQNWALFSGARTQPHQLIVWAKRDGQPDEVLYRPLDPSATFEIDRIEYRRTRAAYDPQENIRPETYPYFARWVAQQALASDPSIDAVGVALLKTTLRTHQQITRGDAPVPPQKTFYVEHKRHPQTQTQTQTQ